jgi:hypothetical protein
VVGGCAWRAHHRVGQRASAADLHRARRLGPDRRLQRLGERALPPSSSFAYLVAVGVVVVVVVVVPPPRASEPARLPLSVCAAPAARCSQSARRKARLVLWGQPGSRRCCWSLTQWCCLFAKGPAREELAVSVPGRDCNRPQDRAGHRRRCSEPSHSCHPVTTALRPLRNPSLSSRQPEDPLT